MTTSLTSSLAAASIAPHASLQRRQVCTFIAAQGARGATDEEVQLALGMNPSSERPRRGECHERGFITAELGELRKTTSGRSACAWHITALGLKACGLPADAWHVVTETAP